jgi:hypothetical protein
VRNRSSWLLKLILLGPIAVLIIGTAVEIIRRRYHLD